MVKYKNFGRSPSSGSSINSIDNQTTGSFSFTTAAQQQHQPQYQQQHQYRRDHSSEHSTKTISTGTGKSKNSGGGGGVKKQHRQQQQQQRNQQKLQELMIDSRCDDDETQHDDDDHDIDVDIDTTGTIDTIDQESIDLRVLSTESNYREGEAESLYDMTSYNNRDHSTTTSVCYDGASSYGYGDSVGDCSEEDSSSGTALSSTNGGGGGGPGGGGGTGGGNSTLSPNSHNTTGSSTRGVSPNTRRSKKLSYMGYVPVSPTTAALMMQTDEGMIMMNNIRNRNNNHHNININNDGGGGHGPFKKISINDTLKRAVNNGDNTITSNAAAAADKNSNNSNSGHTTGAATFATGATGTSFPSIKIDDTSTSRRQQRVFADDAGEEEERVVGEQVPRRESQQRESQQIESQQIESQQRQLPLCTSNTTTTSIGDTCDGDDFSSIDGAAAANANIAEYISPGQQRLLEEEETERVQYQPALLLSLREQHAAIAEIGRQLHHHHEHQHDDDNNDNGEEEEELEEEETAGTGFDDDNGCEVGTTTSSHNGGGGGTMASRTTTTSVTSSVMPNPCNASDMVGHHHHHHHSQSATTMRMIRNNNNNIVSPPPTIQNRVEEDAAKAVGPLSSLHAHQYQRQSSSNLDVGMVPPTLNHTSPPSMMTMVQQQQQEQQYLIQQQQQQYGYTNGNQYQHQPPKQQNFRSPQIPHLYPPPHQQQQQQYGGGGGQHHISPQAQQNQNKHSMSSNHSVTSSSGFVPRNPVLAEQLHAFHQYHHQQQQQQQKQRVGAPPGGPTSTTVNGNSDDDIDGRGVGGLIPQQGMMTLDETNSAITASSNQPFLICGPDGPKLRNVKFVSPGCGGGGGATTSSGNNSTTRRTTNGTYGTYGTNGGGISVATGDRSSTTAPRYGGDGVMCVQYPAGAKCETLLTNFWSTCNAIVTHGYQDTTTDEHGNKKSSSTKQKRFQFEKIADKSIAGLAPPPQHKQQQQHQEQLKDGNGNGNGKLDDSFAANARKIFHNAGSNMMNTLPTDFQNLTPSAAYHNVFDTFQKYYEPEEALYEDKEENNYGAARGGRAAVNSTRNGPMADSSTVISDDSDTVAFREVLGDNPNPHQLDTAPVSPMNTTTAGPQVSDGVQSKPMVGKTEEEEPRSSNPKIELFKKLRQRRRRKNESRSPIRRTSSAPTSPISPTSSMSSVDKEKILESSYDTSQIKQRYIRNIHTKILNIQDKEEKQQDPAVKDGSDGETKVNSAATSNKGPTAKESLIVETVESRDDDSFRDAKEGSTEIQSNVSMQTSTYSWATPEEAAGLKDSADDEDDFLSVRSAESNAVVGEGGEGKMTEEVVLSTSSGMSESLVGSDMDDEEPLDSNINSSISEEEVLSEVDDDDAPEDNMDSMLLESFEHDEYPHTPLDVIMEGSTEETEDGTRTPDGFNNDNNTTDMISMADSGGFSIDNCMSSTSVDRRKDGINVFSDLDEVNEENEMDLISEETETDLKSLEDDESFSGERISKQNRHSFFSVNGLMKILFTLALILQCGIVVDVDLWDHVADHVKSIDGGPYVIATLEDLTVNLKSSTVSLIPTANDITSLKLTVDDIVTNLKSSGGSFIATTNDLIKSSSASLISIANDLVPSTLAKNEVGENTKEDPQETTAPSSDNEELRLFQQLVDEALGSIHSDTESEMVVDIIAQPTTIPDDATSKSEWIQELEETFEKKVDGIESIYK